MFGWLRKKEGQASHGDDAVWMSDLARLNGIKREVDRLVSARTSVVAVAFTLAAFEKLFAALASHQPMRCADMFEREALRQALDRGAVVAVAMPNALADDTRPGLTLPVELLVYGRNDTRNEDDVIVRYADALGDAARVTFQLSFDDALLRAHAEKLKPLLAKLNVPADEAILNPYLTRAIANAQAK